MSHIFECLINMCPFVVPHNGPYHIGTYERHSDVLQTTPEMMGHMSIWLINLLLDPEHTNPYHIISDVRRAEVFYDSTDTQSWIILSLICQWEECTSTQLTKWMAIDSLRVEFCPDLWPWAGDDICTWNMVHPLGILTLLWHMHTAHIPRLSAKPADAHNVYQDTTTIFWDTSIWTLAYMYSRRIIVHRSQFRTGKQVLIEYTHIPFMDAVVKSTWTLGETLQRSEDAPHASDDVQRGLQHRWIGHTPEYVRMNG